MARRVLDIARLATMVVAAGVACRTHTPTGAVMWTDAAIVDALGSIWPLTRDDVPYEGAFRAPPFKEHIIDGEPAAVIGEDSDISVLVVRRRDGRVMIDAGTPSLVSSTVETFVRMSLAWSELVATATPEISDEDRQSLAEGLHVTFKQVDPQASNDDNGLWNVAAEEFGYGL